MLQAGCAHICYSPSECSFLWKANHGFIRGDLQSGMSCVTQYVKSSSWYKSVQRNTSSGRLSTLIQDESQYVKLLLSQLDRIVSAGRKEQQKPGQQCKNSSDLCLFITAVFWKPGPGIRLCYSVHQLGIKQSYIDS